MKKVGKNNLIILFIFLALMALGCLSSCKGSQDAVMVSIDCNADNWLSSTRGYAPGEQFNPTGLALTAVYSDGSRENLSHDQVLYLMNGREIPVGYTFNGTEPASSYLRAVHKDNGSIISKEIPFSTNKNIVDIESEITRKSYWTNDNEISLSGLRVIVHYQDGSEKKVAYDQNQVLLHGGITTNYSEGEIITENNPLEVYYAGRSDSIQLYFNVEDDSTLSLVFVKTQPDKVEYLPTGEIFNPDGLVLAVLYDTGEPVEIPYKGNENDFSFIDKDGNALNPLQDIIDESMSIKILYKGLRSAEFNVYSSKEKNIEDRITGFSLSENSDEPRAVSRSGVYEEYNLPEDLDVIITHSLSGEERIPLQLAEQNGRVAVNKSRVSLDKAGIYIVDISLIGENLASFYTVTVEEKQLESISILRNDTPSYFFKGSFRYPTSDEMALSVIYDNGEEELTEVTRDNFDYSKQYDADKNIGLNEIEVKYGRLKTTYPVTIVDIPTLELNRSEFHVLNWNNNSHVDVYYSVDGSIPSKDSASSTKYTGVVENIGQTSLQIKGIAYLKDDYDNILESKSLGQIYYTVPSDLAIRSVSLLDGERQIEVQSEGEYTLPDALKMKINYEDGHSDTLLVKDNLGSSILLDTDLSLIDVTKAGEYEIRLSYGPFDAAYVLRIGSLSSFSGNSGDGNTQDGTGGDGTSAASVGDDDGQNTGVKTIKSVRMVPDGNDYSYPGMYNYPTHTYEDEIYKRVEITYSDDTKYTFTPDDSNFVTSLNYINSKRVGSNISLTLRYNGEMLQCENNLRIVALPQPSIQSGNITSSEVTLQFDNVGESVITYTVRDINGDIIGERNSLYNPTYGIKLNETCTVEVISDLFGREYVMDTLSYTFNLPDPEFSHESGRNKSLHITLSNASNYPRGYSILYRTKEEGSLYSEWRTSSGNDFSIPSTLKDQSVEVKVSVPGYPESKTSTFTLEKANPTSVRLTNPITEIKDYFESSYTYPTGDGVLTVTYENGSDVLHSATAQNFKVDGSFGIQGERTITPTFNGIDGSSYKIRIVGTPRSSILSGQSAEYGSSLTFSPLLDGVKLYYTYNGADSLYDKNSGITLTKSGNITNIIIELEDGTRRVLSDVTSISVVLPSPQFSVGNNDEYSKSFTITNAEVFPLGTSYKYKINNGEWITSSTSFIVPLSTSNQTITLYAENNSERSRDVTYTIEDHLLLDRYIPIYNYEVNDGTSMYARITSTGGGIILYGEDENNLVSSGKDYVEILKGDEEKTVYVKVRKEGCSDSDISSFNIPILSKLNVNITQENYPGSSYAFFEVNVNKDGYYRFYAGNNENEIDIPMFLGNWSDMGYVIQDGAVYLNKNLEEELCFDDVTEERVLFDKDIYIYGEYVQDGKTLRSDTYKFVIPALSRLEDKYTPTVDITYQYSSDSAIITLYEDAEKKNAMYSNFDLSYTFDNEINEDTEWISPHLNTIRMAFNLPLASTTQTVTYKIEINGFQTYIGQFTLNSKDMEEGVTLTNGQTRRFCDVFEMDDSNIKKGYPNISLKEGYTKDIIKSVVVPSYFNERRFRIYFGSFTNLESVVIPEGFGSNSFSYNETFSNCPKLKNVTLPSSITKIPDNCFYNCTSLSSIVIPEGVREIGNNAFGGCTSLSNISLPSTLITLGYTVFERCTSLENISLPNSVTTIGSLLFDGCDKLKNVVFSNNITIIGSGTFRGCSKLTSVTLPSSPVKICDSCFAGCANLSTITNASSVTIVESNAFKGCSSLTTVIFGDNLTSVGNDAFSGCIMLTNVELGNNVISIGNSAFSGCRLLTNISLGSSLERIADRAFANCALIRSITLPETLNYIGANAFLSCSNLKSITIPSNVNFLGNEAFKNCLSLESITFEQGCDIKKIGTSTFESCGNLKSIVIPDNVIEIFDYAFKYCYGLEYIFIPKKVSYLSNRAFSSIKNSSSNNIITEVYIDQIENTSPIRNEIRAQLLSYSVYNYSPDKINVTWGNGNNLNLSDITVKNQNDGTSDTATVSFNCNELVNKPFTIYWTDSTDSNVYNNLGSNVGYSQTYPATSSPNKEFSVTKMSQDYFLHFVVKPSGVASSVISGGKINKKPQLIAPTIEINHENYNRTVIYNISRPSSANWEVQNLTNASYRIHDGVGASDSNNWNSLDLSSTVSISIQKKDIPQTLTIRIERPYYIPYCEEFIIYPQFATPTLSVPDQMDGTGDKVTVNVSCSNLPASGYQIKWGYSSDNLDNTVVNNTSFEVNKTGSIQTVYAKVVPIALDYLESSPSSGCTINPKPRLSSPGINEEMQSNGSILFTIVAPNGSNWQNGDSKVKFSYSINGGNPVPISGNNFTLPRTSRDQEITISVTREYFLSSSSNTTLLRKFNTPTFSDPVYTFGEDVATITLTCTNIPSSGYSVHWDTNVLFLSMGRGNVVENSLTIRVPLNTTTKTIYAKIVPNASRYGMSEVSEGVVVNGYIRLDQPKVGFDDKYARDSTYRAAVFPPSGVNWPTDRDITVTLYDEADGNTYTSSFRHDASKNGLIRLGDIYGNISWCGYDISSSETSNFNDDGNPLYLRNIVLSADGYLSSTPIDFEIPYAPKKTLYVHQSSFNGDPTIISVPEDW